jgi:Tfp pilus assembly protein PilE
MRQRSTLSRIRDDESGVTLIELLVVMIIAMVTVIALFSFQDLVLRQTTRVFARVDATQSARVAIEKIESRLHSSCVAEGTVPILAGSDNDDLAFISRYGAAASLTPEKHVISLTTSGTLTDTTYPLASGTSSSNWAFSSTASATSILLTNADEIANGAPVFTYYPYGTATDSSLAAYKDAGGDPFVMLLDGSSTLPPGVTTAGGAAVAANTVPFNSPSPLAVPLTQTQPPAPAPLSVASSAAAVKIDLKVFPGGKLNNPGDSDITPIIVSDTVVMRITPVPTDNNQGVPPPCG